MVDILIMPYYRAQLQTCQQLLDQALFDGELTAAQSARIRVQTIDSSHGDEADLVFVDYTRTDDIGFCEYCAKTPSRDLNLAC
jgi:superfamily I DNA and/or RNA helicase